MCNQNEASQAPHFAAIETHMAILRRIKSGFALLGLVTEQDRQRFRRMATYQRHRRASF